MADPPRSSHRSGTPGGDAGTPRWVVVFAIIGAVLLLGFVILHLTGHGFRGH